MITVCICTYNRADSLARALRSLAAQEGVDWSQFEVLIVDNNSTDHTSGVAQAAAKTLPVRHVFEAEQGLSHARNRALREAKGEWIIFTDDDVVVDPAWLRSYADAFDRFPSAEYAGGRVVPHWPDGAPGWFRGERLALMDGLLVWYDLGGQTRMMVEADPTPFGASFAVSRRLAREAAPFRKDLGVRGKEIGRGEETEYLGRARARGAAGVYVHDAVARHLSHPDRFRLAELYRHGVAVGRAHRLMADADAGGSRLRALLFVLRGVVQAAKGRGDRFRQCVINAGIQRGLAGAPEGGGR